MNEHGMHWVTLAGLEHVHTTSDTKEVPSVFVCVLMLVVVFTAQRSILLTLRSSQPVYR